MPYKIGMVSLGCPKNQVDAEMMLAKLAAAGFEITNDETAADLIIVNTCGFIEDAKREAIESILDAAALKKSGNLKALVVTGCLAERYQQQVQDEMPEIDAVIGIGANSDIVKVCQKALMGVKTSFFPNKSYMPLSGRRVLSTPSHWAYLKIADGCSNRCSYCAIPGIRGDFRSRPMEEIIEEAKGLAASGVKELILIAQDTTKYGQDLYGEFRLAALLKELVQIEGLEWIRLFYCYPDRITDELLQVMAEEEKICHYIDIPLQHASGKVLKAMNRTGDRASLSALMKKIRSYMPDISLRTTVMVGFPGEDETDFADLGEFIKEVRFDRLGCFAFSPEENTPAAEMEGQLEQAVKNRRAEVIMEEQYAITQASNQARVGRSYRVIVDGFDQEANRYAGRSYMDAPEIDTGVFFTSEKSLAAGDFVTVLIESAEDYDLIGKAVFPK